MWYIIAFGVFLSEFPVLFSLVRDPEVDDCTKTFLVEETETLSNYLILEKGGCYDIIQTYDMKSNDEAGLQTWMILRS